MATRKPARKTAPAADGVAVLEDQAQIGALLSPLRRDVLRHLHRNPDSAAGLARELGVARQKVNYHLRALEAAGLLELDHERKRRGCMERIVRPTARAYLIGPTLLGDMAVDPETLQDRFSSNYLVAVANRIVHEVTTLERRARDAGKNLPTFTLQLDVGFASAADRAAFADELTRTVATLAERFGSDTPAARTFRFVIGSHPAPKPEAARQPRTPSSDDSGDDHGNRDRDHVPDAQP